MTLDPIPASWGIQDVLIRMMTPMRREFSRALDVQYFLRDPGYANMILSEAETSADERLRGYAQRIKALRDMPYDEVTAPMPLTATTPGSADAPPQAQAGVGAVDAMLGKYTRGLR